MKVTAQEEYGLRCMLQLARDHGGSPLLSRTIADREGLSTDYVKKLLMCLRHEGLVDSIRGVKGGYTLSRAPERITAGQVLAALCEDTGVLNSPGDQLCKQYSGQRAVCIHVGECGIRPMWNAVEGYISRMLAGITLRDLLQEETCVESLCHQTVTGQSEAGDLEPEELQDTKILKS